MNVKTEKNEKVCTLTVTGDVDTLTAPELSDAVSLAAPDCEKMIIDLGGVEYMSSAGIRAIVKARQEIGGDNFSLKNLSPNVQDVLKMTGFLNVIKVE